MAIEVKEMIKFMKNIGYERVVRRKSVVDELLGAFKGTLPKNVKSTDYIKKMRETGYGKY